MISNLLFLALLCSGSVFAAAWTKTRFEEVLPITAMSVVLLVFVFGIAGHLYAGVVFCAIAAVILWLLALIYIIWKKDFKAFISAFITPASVLFVALFFFLSVCNFDRLVGAEFDEYHHWADIVKVMTILDDFGTNAASNSMFASYPPAMAIFQYFFQKIYLLTNQDGVFSEWRLYLAYQLFCYIPLFPFLRNCSLKKPLVIVLYCAAFFVSPLIFFDRLYVNTLIDPFIGFLSGAGLARVLLCNKKNLLYSVYIWMLCATLTISKDAGLMFSLFLVVAYCIDHVIQNVSARDQKPERKNFAKNLVFISAAMATALLPKLLWVIELKLSKTYIQFSGKINFKQLVFILLGKDNTYRSDVWKTYIITQFSHPYQFGTLSLPFFAVTLLTLIGFYWLCRIYKKKWPEKRKNTLAIFAVATIEIFVYLFGMGVMYMFKFSEEEALDLACMSRYLNIVFLSSWILIVTACIYAIDHWCSSRAFTLTALCLLLIISPLTVVANFLNKIVTVIKDFGLYHKIKCQ